MLQIMHKFLDEQDIVDDTTVANESTMLWTNQARDDELQSPDQNPSTCFIESGAQAD